MDLNFLISGHVTKKKEHWPLIYSYNPLEGVGSEWLSKLPYGCSIFYYHYKYYQHPSHHHHQRLGPEIHVVFVECEFIWEISEHPSPKFTWAVIAQSLRENLAALGSRRRHQRSLLT